MNRSVKLIITLAAACALIVPSTVIAAATYYKIRGGTTSFKIDASSTLDKDYGIELSDNASGGSKTVLGNFSLKKGAFVYQSNNSMTADFKKSQAIIIKYDTRGANGHKGGTTKLKIDRLGLTIGQTSSFLIGRVSGSSNVAGVTVPTGEHRVFNIGGGKVKKSKSSKYKYTFRSKDVKFNSQITTMLNKFGTPKGTNKASAKIDLGSMSVKIK